MLSMSSRYELYVGVATGEVHFGRDHDLYSVWNKYPHLNNLEKPPNEFSAYMVKAFNGKDCRELVVAYGQKILDLYREPNHGVAQYSQAVFIRVSSGKGGTTFSPEYLDKIAKLGQIIHYDYRLEFSLTSKSDGYAQLSFNLPDGDYHTRHLCLASLILWIIRKPLILDWCIKQDGIRFRSLLNKLSKEFLKHPDWGDSANDNLVLSVFCSAMYHDQTFNVNNIVCDGPVKYTTLFATASILKEHIRTVFLPHLKGINKVMTPNESLDDVYVTHADYASHFTPMYTALLITETLRDGKEDWYEEV